MCTCCYQIIIRTEQNRMTSYSLDKPRQGPDDCTAHLQGMQSQSGEHPASFFFPQDGTPERLSSAGPGLSGLVQ